jgi:predicted nucleotidyltransferase
VDVLARLDADPGQIADFCRRNGIRRLAVFSSALRHDFTPESDVDLLVEFQPGQRVGYLGVARMEIELEQIIRDHRVDLRTPNDLSSSSRDRVVAEAQQVYDAAV